MRKLFASGVAAVLAVIASGPGGATVFLPFDLASQVGESDLVFEGTVEITFACPNDEGDLPRTCASVAIDRIMKGEHAPSHVTVVVPGGMAQNGTYVRMIGAPTLKEGETVIASTFRTPGRRELVGLVNFDTALLRREEVRGGSALATNAQGRMLRSLPLRGRPDFFEPLPEEKASDRTESALTWAAARRAIENAVAMNQREKN